MAPTCEKVMHSFLVSAHSVLSPAGALKRSTVSQWQGLQTDKRSPAVIFRSSLNDVSFSVGGKQSFTRKHMKIAQKLGFKYGKAAYPPRNVTNEIFFFFLKSANQPGFIIRTITDWFPGVWFKCYLQNDTVPPS